MPKKFNRVAAGLLGLAALVVSTASHAVLPDASAQITEVTTQQAGYATVMFALALSAVGILVGVKWIKRGRGAA